MSYRFNRSSWGTGVTYPTMSALDEEKRGLAASASRYYQGTDTDTARATTAIANGDRAFGEYGEMLSGDALRANPNLPDNLDSKSFLQKLMGGDSGAYNTVQAGLGVGQLGLGLASYLQQKDMAKKQGKLLDQQISNNEFEMGNRRKMVEAFNNR